MANIKNIMGYDVFDTRFEDEGFKIRRLDAFAPTPSTSQNEVLQLIINDLILNKAYAFCIGNEGFYTTGTRVTEATDTYYYSFMSYQGSGYKEVRVYVDANDTVLYGINKTHSYIKFVDAIPTTGIAGTLYVSGAQSSDKHITFSSPNEFQLGLYNHIWNGEGTLQYSTDKFNWQTWNVQNDITAVLQSATECYEVYIRGISNTHTATITEEQISASVFTTTDNEVSIEGKLDWLLNYNSEYVNCGNCALLFSGNSVKDASGLYLCEHLGGEGIYNQMFAINEILISPPQLPATTLTKNCYSQMFEGCIGLDSVPSLPAETLIEGCYQGMFFGCESLSNVPELIAETLAKNCYYQMFYGCTSLKGAPYLPASIMAESCYQEMFEACTSLMKTTSFKIQSLALNCFKGMYNTCTSLEWAPELYCDTLVESCYEGMFEGCTSLVSTPDMHTETLAKNCYKNMFKGCTALEYLAKLPLTTLAEGCYQGMYEGCVSIKEPCPLIATGNLPNNCYKQMFKGCTGIVWDSIGVEYKIPPEGTATPGTDSTLNMFAENSGTIPEGTGTPTLGTSYYLYVEPTYITFTSPESFTLNVINDKTTSSHQWFGNGELQYSTNLRDWEYISSGSVFPTVTSVLYGGSYKIFLRGFGNTTNYNGYNTSTFSLTGSSISIGGKLSHLLDYTNTEGEVLCERMCNLFMNNNSITSASNLKIDITFIPAKETGHIEYGLGGMFKNCGLLTGAPQIKTKVMANSCFANMFEGCNGITELPSLSEVTDLADGCFYSMYLNCKNTGFTTVPTNYLPFTTLADDCYQSMFNGCTALITPPALPAITVQTRCYAGMFEGCTSLTTAPALPAMALANECYNAMFFGCTSLAQTPTLPATTLATNCYASMFTNCTSLTQPPTLPATTMADFCYYFMFSGCTSLTQPPLLPATTLATWCYAYMFENCTGIIWASAGIEYRIPSTGTIIAGGQNPVEFMFAGNGGSIPEGTGTPALETTYYLYMESSSSCITFSSPNQFTLDVVNDVTTSSHQWFGNGTLEYSTNLTTWNQVGSGMVFPTVTSASYSGTHKIFLRGFGNTTNYNGYNTSTFSLTGSSISIEGKLSDLLNYTIAEDVTCGRMCNLFANNDSIVTASNLKIDVTFIQINDNAEAYGLGGMFKNCGLLTGAPQIKTKVMANSCFANMFEGCNGITELPSLSEVTDLADNCFAYMYLNCQNTSFTTVPSDYLPFTTLASYCYYHMFENCRYLTTSPTLAAERMSNYCYAGMFKGCTHFGTAPDLNATTLAEGCYQEMFMDCQYLGILPQLPATRLYHNCYNSMFNGCIPLRFDQTGYTFRIPNEGSITGVVPITAYQNMFLNVESFPETEGMPQLEHEYSYNYQW